MRVVTVVGTRPEIIRLSRVITKLDQHFEHTLIHTGQNYDYELNEIFFSDLSLRSPDIYLDAARGAVAETIAQIIQKVDLEFEKINPDALLILGDTNSCLSAIPAKRRKIPIFHMEAGNRCFDMRVPEEINRKIVDHVADINLTYSEIAREYLIAEGLPKDRIIRTGSPMREVLNFYENKIDQSDILEKIGLAKQGYVLVSAHREENIEDEGRFSSLIDALNLIASQSSIRVVVSTHPRTRQKVNTLSPEKSSSIEFLKPLAFTDYVRLQKNSKYVLSDSGTITEESSILGFDAVNIRDCHERPEGMEEGSVMMSGLVAENILRCVDILSRQREMNSVFRTPNDYLPLNVSDKVVRLIASYTNYVNERVWLKK